MSREVYEGARLVVAANGDAGHPEAVYVHIKEAALPYIHNLTLRIERTSGGWTIEKRHDFKVRVR